MKVIYVTFVKSYSGNSKQQYMYVITKVIFSSILLAMLSEDSEIINTRPVFTFENKFLNNQKLLLKAYWNTLI